MTRQVVFIPTDLVPHQRMLKSKAEREDSEDIYLATRFETYTNRPHQLQSITYPEFFQWWRRATPAEHKKALKVAANHETPTIKSKGPNDFQNFLNAQHHRDQAFADLAECLDAADVTIANSDQLLALLHCLSHLNSDQALLKAVSAYYSDHGIDPPNDDERVLHKAEIEHAEALVAAADLDNKDIASGLATHHWLMDQEPSTALTTTLTRYPPGSMLLDRSDHYWIRRPTMVVTRHRFISPVGDDQEKYYEQKYLLTVPITADDELINNPPQSWMQLCVRKGLCDKHLDALSSLHSAVSCGFHIEAIRNLAQLFVEHSFLTVDEANTFLADIPTLGENELEPQTTITDQVLGDPDTDLGNMIPTRSGLCIQDYIHTFTPSQRRAFDWVTSQLDQSRQIQAAIVGPAGTGTSYLLNALTQITRSHGLVVVKLAPSGVAAHLIGGKTIHNFFALDVESNSTLENGTVQVTCLGKTDVIVIDEFFMLDFFLFRTAEGLCRKFARKGASNRLWGGQHVILLEDPA